MLRGSPRRLPVPLILLAVVVFSGCGPSTGRVGLSPPSTPPAAVEVLALVNEARGTARRCGDQAFASAAALSLEGRLARAAQLHSQDMHDHNVMSHTGSDGSDLRVRADRQGYGWANLGENVAFGYTNPESVVAGWLSSPGHCANIMNPAFTELGVGIEGTFWTQLFGRPL